MSPKPSLLLRLALAVVLFCVVEALVFRTSFYRSVLEPDSTTGYLEAVLHTERNRRLSGPNQVVAVGDSRMCFRPLIADRLTAETGYTFATINTAGTSPRCWYYMLREVDPDKGRYSAVIVPFYAYDDTDWGNRDDDIRDLHYLVPVLRLSDLFEFSLSYDSPRYRWEAFRSILFKGFTYKRDFQDLLVHHEGRMQRLRWAHEGYARTIYYYEWTDADLRGLRVDWKARKVYPPPGLSAEKQRELDDVLLRGVGPYTGQFTAYLRRWIGKIVERYRGTRTRVIFVRLPRGPLVRPFTGESKGSAAREFAARGEAILVPEHTFDELEKPVDFWDPLHLNARGSEQFSILLAREAARVLGRPKD